MKWFASAITALTLGALVGCNTSPPGGSTPSVGGKRSSTFNLKAPATATTVQQGATQEVKITVDRGRDFKEDVTLKVEDVPAGLTVDPMQPVVKGADKEDIKLQVTAAADAKPGDYTLRVTGVPAEGVSTPVDFKVTVKEKK